MKSTTNANWSYELTPAKKQKNRFAPFPRWQERRTRALCLHSARVFVSLAADREAQVNGMAKKLRSNDYQAGFSKIT
jgi:hypothetical protein